MMCGDKVTERKHDKGWGTEHLLMWTVVSCFRAKPQAVSLAAPQKVKYRVAIVVLQSLSHVRLFATPWTAARQASPSFTISWSLPMFMSIQSAMPSNHLILCRPLLFLPSIFPKHQRLSQWVSSSHQVAKVLELQPQHQSFWWVFRVNFP